MGWRAFLGCLAAVYPVYLTASAVRVGIGALLSALFYDQTVVGVDFTSVGLFLRTAPNDLLAVHDVPYQLIRLVTLGLAVVAWLVFRRWGAPIGIIVACIGYFDLRVPVQFAVFRRQVPDPSEMAYLGAATAVTALGLWLVSERSSATGYWRRLLFLAGCYAAPLAVMPLLIGGRRSRWELTAGLFIAAFIPCLVAAIRVPGNRNWRPAWGWIALAGFLSLALPNVLGEVQQTLRERQENHALEFARQFPEVDGPYEPSFFQRGVSFTAESGVHYSSETAREMLKLLPSYGVDAIALIPFGRTRYQPPRISVPESTRTWESEPGIEALTALAHSLGIRVMLKPHVSRPSKERLPTEADREQWLDEFGAFMEHHGRFAHRIHADLLCIGVEFGWLAQYGDDWRRIVERVRRVYPGPVVYAANWGEEFETIEWWDALDYIGLNNYYPLTDEYGMDEIVEKVRAAHERFGKPVIFPEAGYSAMPDAHKRPWHDQRGGPVDLEEQTRCYEALLNAFYDQPWFHGVYWWKVGTNGYGGPGNASMTPWRKPAMEVLARWYRGRPTGVD